MFKYSWHNTDLGLLILRLGVGGIFITTGLSKISNLPMTVGFFASLGLSAFWAYLVSFIELFGGIAMILGVWTRIAAKLLAIIMIMAIIVLVRMNQITLVIGPVALLVSNFALAFSGGGAYSLMRKR